MANFKKVSDGWTEIFFQYCQPFKPTLGVIFRGTTIPV